MIKIILVDDQIMVRTGIRRLLEEIVDFSVIAEVSSGEEALVLARDHQPDCMLMDVSLPGIGALEATRRMLRVNPDLAVIGLGVQSDGPYPLHMLSAGACGYLSKACSARELFNAVRSVVQGHRYVSGDVARRMVVAGVDARRTPVDELSRRELEVLVMVSQAQTQHEIAESLCVSPKTVSTYRTRICRKLGVNTDVELVHIALRYGLIELRS
jgi:two-component system, NarL family, invasion response regulator UvrY